MMISYAAYYAHLLIAVCIDAAYHLSLYAIICRRCHDADYAIRLIRACRRCFNILR